jgi:hypothetical protein
METHRRIATSGRMEQAGGWDPVETLNEVIEHVRFVNQARTIVVASARTSGWGSFWHSTPPLLSSGRLRLLSRELDRRAPFPVLACRFYGNS